MRVMTLTLNPCIDQTYWVDCFGNPPFRTERMSGGKGINVARVLSALGEDCIAVTYSAGETGREFEQMARSEGIHLIAVPVSGETRIIDTYVQESDYRQQVIRHPGPILSDSDLSAVKQAVLELLPQCSVLAVCGSASCEGGAGLIRELISTAKSMGVRTFLDSNGSALTEGVQAIPDVLKVNEQELAQLVDPSDDPLHPEASRLTIEKGIGRVLLTLGERGCVQFQWEQSAFCPAPKIECINAVGSGDCFTAAWLHAQIQGFSDDGALTIASAAGAANALQFPAAMIKKADIEQIVGFHWD